MPVFQRCGTIRSVPGAGESTTKDVATQELLAEVNQAHGTTYRLVRPLSGGVQSGAWLIADPSGRSAVLKCRPDKWWVGQVQRAARSVERIRRQGYPTPAWLAVGATGSGYGYQVQEFVPGYTHDKLTVDVASTAIDVLESQADLDPDPGRSWSSYVADSFAAHWSSITAAVEATGAGGRGLVQVCARLLARFEMPTFPLSDLVHGDFRLGNVLFDDERVSGVIDIEALGSGTRVFDYATLLDHQPAEEDALQLLVDAGSQVASPAVLAYCQVHVLLDLALFMHRRLPTADPAEPDRRANALAARAQFVGRVLAQERHR